MKNTEAMNLPCENPWGLLPESSQDREKISGKNRSFLSDVWFRFHRKPTAVAGLVMIFLLLVFALFGPYFTNYSYSDQNLDLVNIPPYLSL